MTLNNNSIPRRQILNFFTGAAVALCLNSISKSISVKATEAIIAKDNQGNPLSAQEILAQPPGTKILIAGLRGDPTYLTISDEGTLQPWGVVNICPHAGCDADWMSENNHFECPCHNSQFDSQGKVLRGPSGYPLELVSVRVADDYIQVSPWEGSDPRTGETPWWV